MDNEYVKTALEARKRSIEAALQARAENHQDFSDWRFEDTKALRAKLSEINNTLDMMGARGLK